MPSWTRRAAHHDSIRVENGLADNALQRTRNRAPLSADVILLNTTDAHGRTTDSHEKPEGSTPLYKLEEPCRSAVTESCPRFWVKSACHHHIAPTSLA